MNATVRAATLDDVDFLAGAMYLGSTPPPTVGVDDPDVASWMEGARKGTTEDVLGRVENSTTYVIVVGSERAGRLRVVRTHERHMIGGIQILPAYRGNGVGTEVLTTLLHEAHASGVPLVLQVSKDNPNAERLYARLGFMRTGEEGGDYWMAAAPPSVDAD